MPKSEQSKITHEEYFRKYNLSVEQYGEILVSCAFRGEKKPDHHKGYDVEAKIDGEDAQIEVKTKLHRRASVVHCGLNKFGPDGMTNLVVILVDRDQKQSVIEAWLLSREQAFSLRRLDTKSQYINVGDLRNEAKKNGTIKSIGKELQKAAESHA